MRGVEALHGVEGLAISFPDSIANTPIFNGTKAAVWIALSIVARSWAYIVGITSSVTPGIWGKNQDGQSKHQNVLITSVVEHQLLNHAIYLTPSNLASNIQVRPHFGLLTSLLIHQLSPSDWGRQSSTPSAATCTDRPWLLWPSTTPAKRTATALVASTSSSSGVERIHVKQLRYGTLVARDHKSKVDAAFDAFLGSRMFEL